MENSEVVTAVLGAVLDLFNAFKIILPAISNLAFIMALIAAGSYLGAYAKWSRTPGEDAKMPTRSVLFGAAASFICVPFFSSVIHIEYASIMLPIEVGKTPQFVQHALLLISVSGIASYIGYAMLDGIAAKVLREEIQEETEERKKTDEQIFKQQKQLRAKMYHLEAVTNVESAEKIKSENLLKDALKAIEEAVNIYSEDKTTKEYHQASVLKAYILKRLNRIPEALLIIDEQLGAGWKTPVILYNKACYLYIMSKPNCSNADSIKELIRSALTLATDDEAHRKKQEVLRHRVSTNADSDLEGLFTEEERQAIATLGK